VSRTTYKLNRCARGEEVDKTDLIVPRLSLAQKMSDEIDESSPKYIPD